MNYYISSIILEILLCLLQFFYVLVTRLLIVNALRYSEVAINGGFRTFPLVEVWDGTLSVIELLLLFANNCLSGLNRRGTSSDI